jgi:hypothetical protein
LEVGEAVEARCGGVGKKGGGVVGVPGGGVQEGVVCAVEGLEIIGGGEGRVIMKLVGSIVDSCCELSEVVYVQGAVMSLLDFVVRSMLVMGMGG